MLGFIVKGRAVEQGEGMPVAKGKLVMRPKLRAWREQVVIEATHAARDKLLHRWQRTTKIGGYHLKEQVPVWCSGPVRVDVTFHFKTAQARKGGKHVNLHPKHGRHHDQSPDLDKLCRAIGDSLESANIVGDDRMISEWSARKFWTQEDDQVVIMLHAMEWEEWDEDGR